MTHVVDEPTVAEVSFVQQSLWLVDQADPGQPTYNVLAAVRITGPLDVAALEAALNSVAARHDSLRTVFEFDGVEPLQVILPAVTLTVPVDDIGDADPDPLIQAEIELPFDLAKGPLIRMRLLRRSADEHIAVLTVHHIVTDGWSSAILLGELSACYAAHVDGRAPDLEPLPVQYVDYAIWQRETLRGPALDRHVDYWRDQLDGLAPLRLPTDRPRQPVASSAGEVHAFELGGELAARLDALAKEHKVTPFMLHLAGFAALLSRYAGADDISIASPVAGRDRAELSGLIGFFVNTLVLRVDTSADPSFTELLGRVRQTCLGAYAHQEVPYTKLVECLQPARHSGLGGPLAQVMFSLQNLPELTWSSGGLTYEAMNVATRTAKFDLSLELTPGRGSTRCTLEFSTELFDASSIERMAGHLIELLSAAAENPELPISRLRMLGQAERSSLLRADADADADVGTAAGQEGAGGPWCLHSEFARQAAATPGAVALVHGGQRISYAELDGRANQLAWRLRRQGVGAEDIVAIFLPRSPDLVAAFLAVLKAGAAYLPLDPAYPEDRIAYLLSDSGARFILSAGDLAEAMPPCAAQVIIADGDEPDCPAGPPPDLAGPDHLAYVIYTSGSTGRPKGAMNTHRGVTRFAFATAAAFGLRADDRALLLAPLGFDVVAEELYPHLLTGGSVAIPAGEPPVATGELWQLVADSGTTIFSTTPTRLTAMGTADRASVPRVLRTIVFGSEAAPALRALLPWREWGGRLVQVYGVTEASCTFTAVAVDFDADEDAVVPLGHPLAGYRAYVLDRWLEPVPLGIGGELYLGGPAVGRGYHGLPGLTADMFRPDPFGDQPGARLYRTGDIVRRLADGSLQFVERADRQVKIRGFRVEPAEIEAVLGQHPGLAAWAVENRPGQDGQARLVAYTVARDGGTRDDLRAFLASRLPAWMIPDAFVELDRLPLSANGKLDRAALPEPARQAAEYAAPRTPIEEEVAGLWSELLGVERVGIYDNFFELGGNSLAAVRMLSDLRDRIGVEVPLRALFGAEPSVAELGERIFQQLLAEDEMPEDEMKDEAS